MPTVKEVLNDTKKRLKEQGIDTYSLDSSLLVSEVTGLTKIQLVTHDRDEVTKEQINRLENLVKERLKNKPMQYILGHCEFMGLDFKVTENTLIPRGDTENIVEEVIATIENSGYNTVLDMCTGTGAIAISVAHYTKAKVTASDISSKALEVARENAKILNADVNFIESDLFENINETFDVLVSNPPYIESEVIPTLMEQVKDYEPMLALDGGKDGLDFYRNIINQAKNYINQNGCIVFEIGYNQGGQVKSLLENAGFVNINVKQDLAGLDRLVIGFKL